ncbi:MAG: hypothetical protein Q9213_005663 [Squamulea squamosa]
MTSAVDYVFTRDYVDNNRINLQHYLWTELFGYHIHPKISTKDPHLKIADIGTGTALVKGGGMASQSSHISRIWITDLSARLPQSVRLDGLDISSHAVPTPTWLPSNVTIRHWDVKAKVPDDLVRYYDIVHIRNFSFVLPNDEVQSVCENLIKLIKPGGYLQWAEPDVASFRIEKAHPAAETKALTQLLELSQGQDARLSPTWVPHLATTFTKGGLVDVESDVRDAPQHLALAMHECNLSIHELIARKTHNESVAKKLAGLMPDIASETRKGACWAFTRWTVIGRKVDRC